MAYTYQRGVNLGGWISQYRQASSEHFDTFIQEPDLDRIAEWGMDHVRLPLDYPVIEDDSRPGVYKESGLRYIDQCLTWCQDRGLGLILDLHRAPGYSFGTLDRNTLFTSDSEQARYIDLWTFLAGRYRQVDEGLVLELLNEVVEPTSERWNHLAHRAISAIREVSQERWIIYGGNHYNSVDELENIALVPDDDRILYTFHFYKPHLFTHQHAPWSDVTRAYDQTLSYPGPAPELDTFLAEHPEFEGVRREHEGELNRAWLSRLLEPARTFHDRTQKPLYCGEYGVIDRAPLASRIAWHRDVVDLLEELGIGRAVWSYKGMNFGMLANDGQLVSPELVAIVSAS